MKIFAFADLHGDRETLQKIVSKAQKADIVICAGDISIFGSELKMLLHEMNKIEKPVLIIHGNHETDEEMRHAAKGLNNIHIIHRKAYTQQGYKIVGYGGGGFSFTDPVFTKAMTDLKLKKEDKVILVTHQPPHGTATDKIYHQYAGNKSITGFIKKEQPILVICGHLHENEGKKDKIGKTLILNPGYQGVMIEV